MNEQIQSTQVLIIDDDVELCQMLREFLAPDHLQLSACHDGERGLQSLKDGNFDLLILDIMLPGMSGLEVLKQLRTFSDVPVIMLTARGEDIDRILGLEFGADDYIPKPFNPRELVARIKAILRRMQTSGAEPGKQVVGVLELDERTRQVTAAGETLRLTGTEFEILRCLLETPGGVVTREELSKQALGRNLLPYDRSIDTHISNLRGKLENAGVRDPGIQNQRGVGYRLVPEV
jgi:two-component system response regulator CpxR